MSGDAAQLAAASDIRHTSIRSFAFMKRFSALGASLLVFTACTQAALPSEEVFSRATAAIRDFSSASFALHARTEEGGVETWKADAAGIMASGGRQLKFDLQASMGSAASFKGSILIPDQQEVYVRAESVSMGESIAPMTGALEGRWWKIPSGSGVTVAAVPVTPDPSVLAMQLEVLTIAKEHGIERVNQRKAYKYDVTMDEGKLMNYLRAADERRGAEFNEAEWQVYLDSHDIAGTIWIDAELFLPDRIEWTVKSVPETDAGTVLTIDVAFSDHNKEMTVVPPEDSADFPVTVDAMRGLFDPSGSGSDFPLP